MGRVRSHLRANVVGYAALFVALSGTAWAATEIERNEVASKHIRNAGVKEKDLANGAVTSPKVRDASLRNEDFAPGQLPQGERGPAGEPGTRGAAGRDGILDAIGRSTASPGVNCSPGASDTDPNPLECASVSLTLSRTARVHLVADADWGVWGWPPYAGECRLSLDGAPIPGGPVTHPGEFSEPIDFLRGGGLAPVDHLAHLGLTHVTQPLSPGTYRFGLLCHDTNDSITIGNASISALAISPD